MEVQRHYLCRAVGIRNIAVSRKRESYYFIKMYLSYMMNIIFKKNI